MSVRRVEVRPSPHRFSHPHQERSWRRPNKVLACSGMLGAIVAACLALWLPSASSLLVSASSTGAAEDDSDDTTTSSSTTTNIIALCITACVAVILGIIFALCGRRLAASSSGSKMRQWVNPVLQAQIDTARLEWRKDPVACRMSVPEVSRRGATRFELLVHSRELQRSHITQLGGGSLEGWGVCRHEHIREPEDYLDEPWATTMTRLAFRRSGHMLDVVLAAERAVFMSLLSSIVPVVALIVLPFHKLIFDSLYVEDWYGRVEEVDLTRCMIIAGAGAGVHLISFLTARAILHYDRTPSIMKQRAEHRAHLEHLASVVPVLGSVDRNGVPLGPPSLALSRPPITKQADLLQPTCRGSDATAWPLGLFCLAALLSSALLGYQAFISFDESVGRNYGVTGTSKRYWPPTAGKAPLITFVLCILIGLTAMIPVGYSMHLLALFLPRKVHPNLIPIYNK